MTRLVHVLGGAHYGGVETMALQLVRHIGRSEFEHAIVFTDIEVGRREAEFASLGVRLLRAPYVPGDRRNFIARLRKVFEQESADRVLSYAFGNHALVGYAAKRAGVARMFVRVAADPIHDPAAARKNLILAHAARPFCTGEIAVSDHIRLRLTRGLGLPKRRITTIPNGCEVGEIDRRAAAARLERTDDRFRVVMVSRLDRAKDIETLLWAARELVGALPQIQVDIAGDGPLRPALERLARDLALRDHVRFLGTCSAVPELLGGADVLVHPTRTEGFPNVILEGMAAGVPVIASDIPPCREALGDAGAYAAPGDPRGLVLQILALAKDESVRAGRAKLGRERVARSFRIEQAAQRYAEVLR